MAIRLAKGQRYDRNNSAIGKRVELPAFADQWMQGARFGVVKSVIIHAADTDTPQEIYCVKLDNPRIRRQYRMWAKDFRFL